MDCTKEKNPPYNVVFPSQCARLLIEYQEHPEAKNFAPDGAPCESGTRGLLRRAHITPGEFCYVGKKTDRKWEEGDEITSIGDEIRAIVIRKTMELTKMTQHTIEKLIRSEAVTRKTHEHVLKAIHFNKSLHVQNRTPILSARPLPLAQADAGAARDASVRGPGPSQRTNSALESLDEYIVWGHWELITGNSAF